ncbi:hypothetical protein [Chishuiella changwenlii]|uniref:hypothetical protein n=1 Tax=Chishuiella changwenlii TaxID=1434701 RepID=UPI002FDA2706
MKNIYFLLVIILLLSVPIFAQVGIGTTIPHATLEVASSSISTIPDGIIPPKLTGENLKLKDGLYSLDQTGSIIYVTEALLLANRAPKTANVNEIGYYFFDGLVWQKLKQQTGAINGITQVGGNVKLGGTLSEATAITTSVANTLALNGLQEANASTGKILMVDGSNNVRLTSNIANDFSIPSPSVFNLGTEQTNFLNGQGAGGSAIVPMTSVKNAIAGLTYNETTRTISFPTGVYQIIFVYEATHDVASCTISSYFVDFPNTSGTQRIHNTASHNQGALSNQGSTISYATVLTTPTNWQIRLGRGQSGNCSGTGMNLAPRSTHLLIFRIGESV